MLGAKSRLEDRLEEWWLLEVKADAVVPETATNPVETIVVVRTWKTLERQLRNSRLFIAPTRPPRRPPRGTAGYKFLASTPGCL
jgi:hypothetical protein